MTEPSKHYHDAKLSPAYSAKRFGNEEDVSGDEESPKPPSRRVYRMKKDDRPLGSKKPAGTDKPVPADDDDSGWTRKSMEDESRAGKSSSRPRRATAPDSKSSPTKPSFRPRRARAPGATAVASAPPSKRPTANAPGASQVPPPPPFPQTNTDTTTNSPAATAVQGVPPSKRTTTVAPGAIPVPPPPFQFQRFGISGKSTKETNMGASAATTTRPVSLASGSSEPTSSSYYDETEEMEEKRRSKMTSVFVAQNDELVAAKQRHMGGPTFQLDSEPPAPTDSSFVVRNKPEDEESIHPGAVRVEGVDAGNVRSYDSFVTSPSRTNERPQQQPDPTNEATPVCAIAAEVVDEGIDEQERERIRLQAEQDVRQQLLSEAVGAEVVVDKPVEPGDDLRPPRSLRYVALAALCVVIVVIAVVVGVVVGTQDDSSSEDNSSATPSPTDDIATPAPTPIITNNFCENATRLVLDGPPIWGSTAHAPEEAVEQCGIGSNTGTETGRGVWYEVVGDGHVFRASTCHSLVDMDTVILVFRGSCNNLFCVDGNDQFCGDQSSVWWATEVDVTYFILVRGWRGNTGSFELSVEHFGQDGCGTALSLPTDGSVVLGDTRFATLDNPGDAAQCGGNGITAPGVWFSVVGTGSVLLATTCHSGSLFDTKLTVFGGSCAELTCVGHVDNDYSCGISNDLSTVSWFPAEGEISYILVHGDYQTGLFQLSVTASDPITNDVCENAIEALINPLSPIMGTTFGATFDNVGTCGTSNVAPGVWYTVVGTGGFLQASTCNVGDVTDTDFDTKVSVFSGSCDDLVCVGGNDDACRVQSSVTWTSISGTLYFILVHGYIESYGNFRLDVTTP